MSCARSSTSAPKGRGILIREALTWQRLGAMAPDEAAATFVARRAEGLTAQEEALLADWLAADEAHARAMERVERGWSALDGAGEHELLSAMRAHALQSRRTRWSHFTPQAAAAAILILLAGAGLMLFLSLGGPKPGREGSGEPAILYAAAPREVRTVALADGSRMTLDAGSRAVARFGPQQRNVELLEGRAFFAVAHEPARPFAVTAADRRIVAVGTRFDVRLEKDGLTVSLIEGRVTVGPADGSAPAASLAPGQQYVERSGQAVIRPSGAQDGEADSWTRGVLSFHDESLAAASAEVGRYAPVPIIIREPAVAALRVSGEFRAGDSLRFAETVAELHRLRVVRRADGIELSAAPR